MSGVNKVIIVGRLGQNPRVTNLPDGGVIANFSVATSEKWTDKNGNPVENTEWHNFVSYGKLAEIVSKYLVKGSQVYLEGKLRTRKYVDKQGIERYLTEIIAQELTMLGSKSDSQATGENASGNAGENQPNATTQAETVAESVEQVPVENPDDEIPF